MARTAISRKPLVFIDRCPSHGDWLDGGELGQLKALARTRGVDVLLDLDAHKRKPDEKPSYKVDLPLGQKPGFDGWGMHRRKTDLFDVLDIFFGGL
jgi:Zn-finger nucleic acid-binding protein